MIRLRTFLPLVAFIAAACSLVPAELQRELGLSEEVKEIAWKAQHRLTSRYRRLTAKGKQRQKIIVAIARELLGFVWAIGIQVDKEQGNQRPRRVA